MPASISRFGAWYYRQPYLLLATTMLFWGGNFVVGRAVVGQIPPVQLTFIRWMGAALILLPFAWPHIKRDWPVIAKNWAFLLLLSITGISVFNTLGYTALQYTTAINGALIQSSAPVLIAFWSLVLTRTRLTTTQALGIAVSFVGVATIVSRGDVQNLAALRINIGDVWVLVAMFVYAFYSAVLPRRPKLHPLSFLCVIIACGGACLLPLALWEALILARHPVITGGSLAAIGYVVIFPSVLAYICFNRGVELVGPNRAGPFFHLIPLFASVLAIIFLDERPRGYHALGYCLVLAGILVAQRRQKPVPPATDAHET